MARSTVTKLVDGEHYQFQQFNTTTSLKVLARLTKLLAEPISLGIAAVMGEGTSKAAAKLTPDGVPEKMRDAVKDAAKKFGEKELNTELFVKAVRALAERLDEDEVVGLVTILVGEGVLCNHKPVIFDLHFEGRPGHLFKVLFAALEVQYGNFIGASSARSGAAGLTGGLEAPIGKA